MIYEGVVTKYKPSQDYGHITTHDLDREGKSEVYFEVSDYPYSHADEGSEVRFRIGTNNKGYRTVEIVSAPEPENPPANFGKSNNRYSSQSVSSSKDGDSNPFSPSSKNNNSLLNGKKL